MRYAWCSDIHLDHVRDDDVLERFSSTLRSLDLDGLIVTGDIGNAHNLQQNVKFLSRAVEGKPVMFVLGNHDFWYSGVSRFRSITKKWSESSHGLIYLTTRGHVSVGRIAIVGHDGWYDGRNGLGAQSKFFMNDWTLIEEYQTVTRQARKREDVNMNAIVTVSNELAKQANDHLTVVIADALTDHDEIIVCTHVPPWQEAHFHEGSIGDQQAAPWFTSFSTARLLEMFADENPTKRFTVLCGHTHGRHTLKARDNLTCRVAGAEYTRPVIEDVIEIEP